MERNDSPPEADSHPEEVELDLSVLFEEESQGRPIFPMETIVEEVDAGRSDESQKSDEQQQYLNSLCGKEILQLKSNAIPRGLVPLEKLFDHNDVAKDPKLVPNCDDVEEVNIGTATQPKIIKLSRALLPAAR